MTLSASLDLMQLVLSFGLSLVIGGLAYRRQSLTRGGWLAAVLVGTTTAGLGGWTLGSLVVVFFVTSSGLSHWKRAVKERWTGGSVAKGSQRDFVQVLANGGAAAGLSILYAVQPFPAVFAAALGAVATVTADTWATEVGSLSSAPPRLITSGRQVPAGTSGGVSWLGSIATPCGALLIAAAGLAAELLLTGGWTGWIVPIALVGGVAGAMADSVMGATVQRVNRCPRCQVDTERKVHSCGTQTRYYRGLRWLDNDWVNFLASLVGAVTSAIIWVLMAG